MPGDVSRARCRLRVAEAIAVCAVVVAGEFATACSHRASTPAETSGNMPTKDGGANRTRPNTTPASTFDGGTRAPINGGQSASSAPTQPGTSQTTKDGGTSST